MRYFFINIPYNELLQLENKLPKGCYCFFKVQNASSRYYGMIKKDAYPVFTASLSPETQQHVEMLDKKVFQLFFLQSMADHISFFGNRRLMVHLSDEQ